MPAVNENSKRRSRSLAIVLAFLVTSLVHSAILFAAARILNSAGAIAWVIDWQDAVALGTMAVVWRMWLRNRD